MCRELSALGVREPQYNLVAFIMKATVCANVLDEGQETTQKNYPETTQIQEIDQQGQEKGKKRTRKGQEKILEIIRQDPHISVSSIAEQCEMSVKSVRNLIDGLRADNVLARIGPDKGGYWEIIASVTND